MSIEVTQGSVVQVDPEELRWMAVRVQSAVDSMRRASGHAEQARAWQAMLPREAQVLWTTMGRPGDRILWFVEEGAGLVLALRNAADAYEIVELRTLLAMHGDGAVAPDGGSAAAQLEALAEANPDAARQATRLVLARLALTQLRFADHWRSAETGSPLAPGGGALAGLFLLGIGGFRALNGMGRGSVREPERARERAGLVPGTSDRHVFMSERDNGVVAAPRGLSDSLTRIPNFEGPPTDDQERVRVDAYTMRDGERRFVAYVIGSSEFPLDTSDPFSWSKNLGLYMGEAESAGYDFVLEALQRSGAQAGDVVDINGFSQGAMIAQRVATDSDFDVQHVTTIGAPLHVPMGDAVTSVTLAHEDDPVAMLADGGSPVALGGDDSLLIRDAYKPLDEGLAEWDAEAHRVGSYAETAATFEASGDPRAEGVQAYYARLGEAASVQSISYYAPEWDLAEGIIEAPLPRGDSGARPSA
ncbi:hypothetical protein [Microbacterium sp. G2-8]|uniref:hypothetical protein n=1 Tax=Microbacterium sp. G2-8 TaxID=2842454 RepID=UPI001C8B00D4|nr:hypothetical protein [Microbacterium sp. G2-8]